MEQVCHLLEVAPLDISVRHGSSRHGQIHHRDVRGLRFRMEAVLHGCDENAASGIVELSFSGVSDASRKALADIDMRVACQVHERGVFHMDRKSLNLAKSQLIRTMEDVALANMEDAGFYTAQTDQTMFVRRITARDISRARYLVIDCCDCSQPAVYSGEQAVPLMEAVARRCHLTLRADRVCIGKCYYYFIKYRLESLNIL